LVGVARNIGRPSFVVDVATVHSAIIKRRGAVEADIDHREADFGYYSAAVTNMYVNQERRISSYAWKQVHAVCGFDFLPEPIKRKYFQLFTTRTGTPVPDAVAPIGTWRARCQARGSYSRIPPRLSTMLRLQGTLTVRHWPLPD
jgi:hypothetical protein